MPELFTRPSGRVAAAALLMGLFLSGCSASASQEAPASDSTTEAASEAPTPTPTTATEEQVASVIAGYEEDWREVISEASDCRFAWVMQDPGALAKAERMTCYMREGTAGTTAQSALNELDALSVPGSLTSLVTETKAALQAVADVDLESECGSSLSEPNNSRKCDRALGSRMWAYGELETAIDSWSPYL